MARKKCIPDTDAENARLETNKAYLSQYARLFFRKKGRAARIRSMRQEADAVASVWGEHVSGGAQTAPYGKVRPRTLKRRFRTEFPT